MTATTNNGPPSASVAEPGSGDANTNGDIISGSENGSIDAVDENEEPKEIIATKVSGTVKWFNTSKGFGFIAPDGGSKDVFVHISAVERAGLTGLNDDQKVTFDIEPGRDGRESATNIALA